MLQTKPYKRRETKRVLAVADFETDPFAEDRVVEPFACGFKRLDTNEYHEFWGDNCALQLFEHLGEQTDDFLIYFHNGGKFDIYFCLPFIDPDQEPRIINGRVVSAKFCGHEIRDSFAIIPTALKGYKKKEIDYAKMERGARDIHRAEISDYLKSDCDYLGDLVSGFHDRFGDRLTIGGTAQPQLNALHGFASLNDRDDETFRAFYYGGRVECFKTGIMEGEWKVYDVNSMYPFVMANFKHPVSSAWRYGREIGPKTAFAEIRAKSRGALPFRSEDGSLHFPHGRRTFFATIHEIQAGLETGTLEIEHVEFTYDFDEWTTFHDFVKKFYDLRLEAKATKDEVGDTLYKLILNSAYGRFAIDPRKFKNYKILKSSDPPPLPLREIVCAPDGTQTIIDGWFPDCVYGDLTIWARKAPPRPGSFSNVATAASITGAARSVMLRGLAASDTPAYCDTDSDICLGFSGNVNDKELGAWKPEQTGTQLCIAGKKMYALFAGGPEYGIETCVKKACKGVNISGVDIRRVAMGEEIEYANPVPKFSLDGSANFVKRRVRKTGNVEPDWSGDDAEDFE